MKLALICIGDELLNGKIADKNAHTLAKILAERGHELTESRILPDNPLLIKKAFDQLKAKTMTTLSPAED
jgi:molybdopterin-biosynthesis enzyme MoeA-like protein